MLAVCSLAQAECFSADPLCHAMHDMDGALDCVQGDLPAFMCGDDSVGDLAKAASEARQALDTRQPQAAAQINALFDQLDAAIAELKAAGTDAPARALALTKIKSIRDQGHLQFKQGSAHP